ncbi:MAG: TlyA family RNA methyltransferase [Deltaproteobacteria bacterium]|nr:TlyA family RNA methyltransferase [Deltaproteobacteria bacterium]
MKKERIDKLLVDKGLAPSRERAQAWVMAGLVFAGGQKVSKASQTFLPEMNIEVKGQDHPYVSRGGVKLAGALDHFQLSVKDWVCLDVGASTGGFTDCLLQRGAKKVYALDVGHNQLAWKIRQDPRVLVIEKVNIRYWEAKELSEVPQLVVADVSFISLSLVIPPLFRLLDNSETFFLCLIKPQFEVGRKDLPSGGVLKDEAKREEVLQQVLENLKKEGAELLGSCPSSLPGTEGNLEYFAFFKKKPTKGLKVALFL